MEEWEGEDTMESPPPHLLVDDDDQRRMLEENVYDSKDGLDWGLIKCLRCSSIYVILKL